MRTRVAVVTRERAIYVMRCPSLFAPGLTHQKELSNRKLLPVLLLQQQSEFQSLKRWHGLLSSD